MYGPQAYTPEEVKDFRSADPGYDPDSGVEAIMAVKGRGRKAQYLVKCMGRV